MLVVRTVLCPPKCGHSGAVPFNVTAVTAYPNQNLISTHVDLREASTSGTSICHLDTSTVDVSISKFIFVYYMLLELNIEEIPS